MICLLNNLFSHYALLSHRHTHRGISYSLSETSNRCKTFSKCGIAVGLIARSSHEVLIVLHSIIEQYRKHRTLPIHFGIVVTLLLIPFWYRFPGVGALGMGDFTVFYSAGFIIFWSLLWTVIWWAISGFVGFRQTWSNRNQRAWIVLVLIFAGWILLSWAWSYKRDLYPSVAIGAALPFILAIFFAIC